MTLSKLNGTEQMRLTVEISLEQFVGDNAIARNVQHILGALVISEHVLLET